MKEESRKSRTVEWGSLFICVLLIAAVALSGVLSRPKIWPDVQLDYVDGKKAFSVQDGDEYGIVASGPYYDLPVGTYRIKWQIDGDGNNRIVLNCFNDAQITPSVIELKAGQWEGEAYFEIKEPTYKFSINIEFSSGEWMEIYNVRLYSPEYTDHVWTFAYLVLGIWFLLMLSRKGVITQRRKQIIIVLSMTVLYACVPVLKEDHPHAYDVQFHAARLMNLVDGLKAGQLPVRVGGFSYNGYGAATSVFYPDRLLYPFALMLMSGASMAYVLNIYIIAVTILTAAMMYIAAKRFFASCEAAVCSSILYTLNLYRLADVYERFMAGEILAIAFLPLFLLGMYEIIFGDENQWILLSIGATLIFQSHMISTLLSACVAVGMCALFCGKLLAKKERVQALFKACIMTLLINLGTLIPFVMYYFGGVNTSPAQFGFANWSQEIYSLFSRDGYVGMAIWFALASLWCIDDRTRERKYAGWFAVAGILLTYMTSKGFPWNYAVALVGDLLEIVQFPSRILIWGTLFLCLAGGYGLSGMFCHNRMFSMMLTLCLAVLFSMPCIESEMNERDGIEFGQGARVYMLTPEYQIRGTRVDHTRSRQPILSDDIQVIRYEKKGTSVIAQISTEHGGKITFPLFGFEGYVAELNGERVMWTRGENNCLSVEIPAGTQAELNIWFEGNRIWRLAEGISLITLLYLVWHAISSRRKAGDI